MAIRLIFSYFLFRNYSRMVNPSSSSSSSGNPPKRVLFPPETPPIPLHIGGVRNSTVDASPLPFSLLPPRSDSMEESSSEDAATAETPQPPSRIFKTEFKRVKVAEYLLEMKRNGGPTCHYCNKEDCPNRFDLWWTRHRLQNHTVFENRVYESEQEIYGNAKRRQIFFEYYWETTRKLYNTRRWTPRDFMYIPKCAHICARYLFPAPKDTRKTFSDKEKERHANRGLEPLW